MFLVISETSLIFSSSTQLPLQRASRHHTIISPVSCVVVDGFTTFFVSVIVQINLLIGYRFLFEVTVYGPHLASSFCLYEAFTSDIIADSIILAYS